MALVIADRVQEATSTAGTGPFVCTGAAPGLQRFSAVMAIGDTCHYSAYDPVTFAWEIGVATYTAANTLTRTTVSASSNANAAVAFAGSAGTTVFIDLSANLLKTLLAGASGTTADTLGQAFPVASTDRLLGFQPSAVGAANTLVSVSPDQLTSYAANNPSYVATVTAIAASVSAQLLDRTNHGKRLITTADTTIQAPLTMANLGGDGYAMTLLNPGGYVITLAPNGSNTIASGGVTTTTAPVVQFYATATQVCAFVPGAAGSASPTLIYAGISAQQPAVAATVTYNFNNGAPASPTLSVDGGTVSATPTITTSSGSGATARGTVAFAFTTPAAGTHVLAAATTGTYAAVSANTSLSFAVSNSLSITTQPTTAGNTGNVTLSGTYTGAAPTGFSYAWNNAGGSGTVPTFTATGGAWSATFPTATVLGSETVTITGTGPNTSSATSATITVAAPLPFAITAVVPQAIGNVTVGSMFNVTYTGTWAVPTTLVDGGAVTPTANSAGTGGVGTIRLPVLATSGRHTISVAGSSGSAQTSDYWLNAGATNTFAAQWLFSNFQTGPSANAVATGDTFYPMVVSGASAGQAGLIYDQNAFSPDATHAGVSTLQGVFYGSSHSPVVPPPLLNHFNAQNRDTANWVAGTKTSGGSFGTYYSLPAPSPANYAAGDIWGMIGLTDVSGGQWLLITQHAFTTTGTV